MILTLAFLLGASPVTAAVADDEDGSGVLDFDLSAAALAFNSAFLALLFISSNLPRVAGSG